VSKFAVQVANIHRPIDNALLRALSFILAIGHSALLMWEPTYYDKAIGGFSAVVGLLFIWAICSGVIFGIGFKPVFVGWSVLFSPYFSLTILFYLTISYLFV